MSDGHVKRLSEMVRGLMGEIMLAEMIPPVLGKQIMDRNISILYSSLVMAKSCGIRHKVLELVRKDDPDLYPGLVSMCESYDRFNTQELLAEMQGDVVGMSEAQTAIEKIMGK